MSGYQEVTIPNFLVIVQTAIHLIGIEKEKIGEKMEISKTEISSLLEKTEIRNKILNSFNEFLQFQSDLKSKGLQFEKTVTKFSKTSAAIYLPKRLIGKTFRVFLMPINDGYEVSVTDKQTDKLLKDTEKELNAIQEDNRKNLLTKPIEPIY